MTILESIKLPAEPLSGYWGILILINIEFKTIEGPKKGIVISFVGVNLTLSSLEVSNLVFSAYGAAACGTLTHVDYFEAGIMVKY